MSASENVVVDLVMSCAYAIIAKQKTITISTTGKKLPKFPRGKLLSINNEGVKNYAVCPIKVLTWVHNKS